MCALRRWNLGIIIGVLFFALLAACRDDGPSTLDDDAASLEEAPPKGNPPAEGPASNEGGGDGVNPNVKEMLSHKSFQASDDNFLNPERGFYTWIDLVDDDDFGWVREAGFTLAYAAVLLDDYMDSPLSDPFLEKIGSQMELVRKAGIKVVMRFRYSDSSDDPVTDAPLGIILKHIDQLIPFFEKNSDVIAAVQAGFIGRWGEWHSSSNDLDNEDSRAAVIEALLDALPSSRMIQLRRPWFKSDYLGTNDPTEKEAAYGGTDSARIGHHNDCFLASATDMGTYPSDEVEFWKNYISSDALYVPVGGETCKVNKPATNCQSAMEEMGRLRWSYLNSEYHEDVINDWNDEGCLIEIASHLGYRFVLTDAWWNPAVAAGEALHVRVRLENEGFAAPFNEKPVYAVIRGNGEYIVKLDADPRFWTPGEAVVFEEYIEIPPNAPPGKYDLLLWLPDSEPSLSEEPAYSIRFANEDVWLDDEGLNFISEFYIEPSQEPK